MTESSKPFVRFGADWRSITPADAAKVPLAVADLSGTLHTVRDVKGNTPLHLAAAHSESPEVIAALMQAGANPNCENNIWDRETPFTLAVRHENLKIVTAMIDAGYTPDIFWVANNVDSPEMVCAIAGEMGIDWQGEYNDAGHTPLQCAVLAKNPAAVKGFINAAGIVDAGFYLSDEMGGGTMLHFAVENYADRETVKALIDAEVGVNYLDLYGRTPLDDAEGHDLWDVAEELREAGGYTCDESAGVCFGVNWKTAVPGDVSGINHDDRGGDFFGAPIHWAARYCPNPAVIDALVASGADVNLEYRNSTKQPLYCAVVWGNAPVVAPLIKAGANADYSNSKGETLLHIAINLGHHEVIIALAKAGADVNGINNNGETPLDMADACLADESEAKNALVAAGAMYAVDIPRVNLSDVIEKIFKD